MKIISTLFVFLFVSPIFSYCQDCLSDGYDFDSQWAIDNFTTNFPGCTQILGDVEIKGDITDLSGLDGLISIGGYLNIQTQAQVNLIGLNNIGYIGGHILINGEQTGLNCLNNLVTAQDIIFQNNNGLIFLDCFSSLQTVEGKIGIAANPQLESIQSLGNLENIAADGHMLVKQNPKLASLDGLQSLTQVDGDIIISENENLTSLYGLQSLAQVDGDIIISENENLTSLDSLQNLAQVGGNFTITENEALTSLDSLLHLTSVGGTMEISYNPALKSLAGLDSLAYTLGLSISYNDSLASLAHLSGLEEAGYFSIRENPQLTDLEGLGALKNVGYELSIYYNDNLETLTGLNLEDTIEGGLAIAYNPKLASVEALNGLTVTKERLVIYNNDSLADLTGLGNLHKVGGDFNISGNPLLPNLHELENLDSVGGDLGIKNLPLLTSLAGLENLQDVGGYLSIGGIGALSDLNALSNLKRIGGSLNISNNPQLTSLAGLDSTELNFQIYINSNPMLSVCGIPSVCAVLSVFGGWTNISGNAPGCATLSDVNAACGVNAVEEEGLGQSIRIYPNPGSGAFTIESDVPGRYSAHVVDGTGRKVAEVKADNGRAMLDLSGLPDGMYFVRLVFDGGSVVRRVVKMKSEK